MIKLKNMSFSYDSTIDLFENFSYFSESRRIGIIGDNGSGKTTLLNLLSNEITPTNGDIKVDGSVYMSVYDFNYYKKMTINELISLGETLTTFNFIKLDEVVKGLRLEQYLNIKLKNLSQGTFKKVGILFSLLSNADILLIDEPFESLDFESCNFIKEFMMTNKTSYILVDHHIDDVIEITDEVIDLNLLSEEKLK